MILCKIRSKIIRTVLCCTVYHSCVQSYAQSSDFDVYFAHNLQSSTAHLLQRPLVHASVASHAFIVAASTLWNSLSVNTRSADSFASIKYRLKSELFASAYAT